MADNRSMLTSPLTSPPVLGRRSRLKHERIYTVLVGEIASGRLRPGDSLPTEHQLAEMMQVSRSTIRQTLGDLEKEGMVRRVRGQGTFVTEQVGGEPSGRTEAMALVLPETRTVFFPSIQYGFGGECRQNHHQMIVCDADEDIYKQTDAILQLIDRRVSGVALMPLGTAPTPPHHIRPLQDQNIPVVFCHRRVDGIQAPLITFSGHEVGCVAGRAIGEQGHRTIAYFAASSGATLADQYESGLRETIHQFGGTLPEQNVHYGTHTHGLVPIEHERAVEAKLKQILAGPDRPTAIMTSFDSSAESLYLQLGRLGLRVPEDISLVGFGGTWREGAVIRQLTSVTVDEAELGRHAARLLHEMHEGSRSLDNDEEIVLPLSLSDGQTLGSVPKES